MYQRKKEHDEGENALVLQMEKREKKRSELEIIKILIALVYLCTILHPLMWVFFCSKCVKSVSFSILHNFAQTDIIALTCG